MKIQDQDIYHGSALMQIVEYPSFKALNKADDGKYGHYTINDGLRLFVKYRKHSRSPWQFTFQPDELTAINADIASGAKTFVCLVCGDNTICCLTGGELQHLLNLQSGAAQSVKVEVPIGGSQHISGPKKAKLRNAIPHNAFPAKLFQ